jgi:hypothetical protein
MAVYRAYYGDALYGQDTFGLSGSITDGATIIIPNAVTTVSAVKARSGSATATPSVSVTANAQRIHAGSSSDTSSASVSASAVRSQPFSASASATSTMSGGGGIIKDGAVTASLQNVFVSVAETYPETEGYRSGYGLRTYGTNIYGENHSIEDGSATITPSLAVTANGQRVVDVSLTIVASSTFTSNGVIDIVGRATINATLTVDPFYNRVRLMSASDSVALTTTVSARYKWLDSADPTTIWTDAPDPSDTWTDADYLERAA